MEEEKKVFAVTGARHGSIAIAVDEEEARRLFQEVYSNEEIIAVKDITAYNLENL